VRPNLPKAQAMAPSGFPMAIVDKSPAAALWYAPALFVTFLVSFGQRCQAVDYSGPTDRHDPIVQASDAVVLENAAKVDGKLLFGTVTSPLDALPIDVMLAHQLAQSRRPRSLDKHILFLSDGGCTDSMRTEHQHRIEQNLLRPLSRSSSLSSSRLAPTSAVDSEKSSVRYIDEVRRLAAPSSPISNTLLQRFLPAIGRAPATPRPMGDSSRVHLPWQTAAASILGSSAANGFGSGVIGGERSSSSIDDVSYDRMRADKGQRISAGKISFLISCLDELDDSNSFFDYCAWVDPDVFLHGGENGWVDDAIAVLRAHPDQAIVGVLDNPRDLPTGLARVGRILGSPLGGAFVISRRVLAQRFSATPSTVVQPTSVQSTTLWDTADGQAPSSWAIKAPSRDSDLRRLLQGCSEGASGGRAFPGRTTLASGLAALLKAVEEDDSSLKLLALSRYSWVVASTSVDPWLEATRRKCDGSAHGEAANTVRNADVADKETIVIAQAPEAHPIEAAGLNGDTLLQSVFSDGVSPPFDDGGDDEGPAETVGKSKLPVSSNGEVEEGDGRVVEHGELSSETGPGVPEATRLTYISGDSAGFASGGALEDDGPSPVDNDIADGERADVSDGMSNETPRSWNPSSSASGETTTSDVGADAAVASRDAEHAGGHSQNDRVASESAHSALESNPGDGRTAYLPKAGAEGAVESFDALADSSEDSNPSDIGEFGSGAFDDNFRDIASSRSLDDKAKDFRGSSDARAGMLRSKVHVAFEAQRELQTAADMPREILPRHTIQIFADGISFAETGNPKGQVVASGGPLYAAEEGTHVGALAFEIGTRATPRSLPAVDILDTAKADRKKDDDVDKVPGQGRTPLLTHAVFNPVVNKSSLRPTQGSVHSSSAGSMMASVMMRREKREGHAPELDILLEDGAHARSGGTDDVVQTGIVSHTVELDGASHEKQIRSDQGKIRIMKPKDENATVEDVEKAIEAKQGEGEGDEEGEIETTSFFKSSGTTQSMHAPKKDLEKAIEAKQGEGEGDGAGESETTSFFKSSGTTQSMHAPKKPKGLMGNPLITFWAPAGGAFLLALVGLILALVANDRASKADAIGKKINSVYDAEEDHAEEDEICREERRALRRQMSEAKGGKKKKSRKSSKEEDEEFW